MSSAELHIARVTNRELLGSIFDEFYVLSDHFSAIQNLFERIDRFFLVSRGRRSIRVIGGALHRLKALLIPIQRQIITRTVMEILKSSKPSCVVLANDRAFPVRQLSSWARQLGTRSILVQESLRKDEVFKGRRALGLFANQTGMNGQGGADRIAAWGETSRQYYIRVGAEPERITLSGNTRMDELLEKAKRLSCADLRKRYGFSAEGRLILFGHRQS